MIRTPPPRVLLALVDGGHIAAPADGGTVDNGETTWVPKEAWAFITQF
jgi:hypothetical protein